ncbi:MAG: beta-galactosidase [Victivallales bacterium]|nr:beta-galactosidase [Victivallales bacterium]
MKRFLSVLLLACFTAGLFGEMRRVWYDGSSANYWSDCFDVSIRHQTLHYGEFRHDAEQGALDFRFRLRADGPEQECALVYGRPAMPPAETIVISLRNLGEQPLRLMAAAWSGIEAGPGFHNWKGWDSSERPEVPADGQWHEFTFSYAPEGQGGSGQYPIDTLACYLLDVVPEQEVHLQIRRIELVDDLVPLGKCENALILPMEVAAGKPFVISPMRVEFRHRMPIDERVWLEFKLRGPDADAQAPVKIALKEVERTGMRLLIPEQEIQTSQYLLSGEYMVSLHCGEAQLRSDTTETVVKGRTPQDFPKCEVVDWKGAPTIQCNGEILPGVMRATYTMGPLGFRAFRQAGVRIFAFTATPNLHAYHSGSLAESEPGVYDFSSLDESVQTILAEAPDAYLIPRVFLGAPVWWCEEHPDDCVWIEEEDGSRHRLLYVGGRPVPSWSSQVWREYAAEGLRRMLEHIRHSAYADRIIGILLTSGTTEEWMAWGDNENLWGDYSPAAQTHFRNWLRENYASEAELQTAWQEPQVTFAAAEMPTRAERSAILPQSPDLRDLDVSGDVKSVDYYRWNAGRTAETIAFFAHVVKEATGGRMMVGPFYGYLFELAFGHRLLNSGHTAVGKLLANPEIDFFASPLSYAYREVGGDGIPMNMGPAASLALHNKFWIVEMDVRTSETNGPVGHCGKPADLEGDLLQQDKVAIHTLCAGLAQWWFDVGYVNYSNPTLMAYIGKLARVMDEAVRQYDRTSEAQIAYVVDEQSLPYCRVGSRLAFETVTRNVPLLERLGATVEYYLASDLERLPERIRLVILGTSFAPDESQLQALKRLKTDGRVILFLHAPAFYPWRKGQTASEAMQEFTGLPLGVVPDAVAAQAVMDFPDGKWLPPDCKGQVFAADRPNNASYRPCPFVEPDAHTLVLAHLPNAGGAIAEQEHSDWTALYCTVAMPPRELLLSAMKKAGVHRYITSADQVWATKGLLGVCVKEGGAKTIALKSPGQVRDALSGEVFFTDADGVFTVEFTPRSTRLFYLEK